jgi:hypothetical protein
MTRQQCGFLYAVFGLIVGAVCIVLGAWLILQGVVDPHQYSMKLGQFEINASAPGLAFACCGVVVIWLTKF